MKKISVTINGVDQIIEQCFICDLIKNFQLDEKKIAIEKNLEIIPIQDFAKTAIENGDKIEIVHFIGGG